MAVGVPTPRSLRLKPAPFRTVVTGPKLAPGQVPAPWGRGAVGLPSRAPRVLDVPDRPRFRQNFNRSGGPRTVDLPRSQYHEVRGPMDMRMRNAYRRLRPLWKRYVHAVVGRAGSPLAAGEAALLIWQATQAPEGFPGFANINPGWFAPGSGDLEVPHGSPVGEYIPDHIGASGYRTHDQGSPQCQLCDLDDLQFQGFFTYDHARYWGHFPDASPYSEGGPRTAENWPTGTFAVPSVAPAQQGYNRPRDLSRAYQTPVTQTAAWGFTVGPPGSRVRLQDPVPNARPPKGQRERKVRFGAAGKALWAFAAGLGEVDELAEILAEASEYHPDSMIIPEGFPRDTALAHIWWLFWAGGIHHIDFEQLKELLIENEIEDRIFGALGQMGGSAARNLGLTVGPQTGPVL